MAASDELQAIIGRSPYLSWLGLQVMELGKDEVTVRATWREEWVANPTIGQTQGGILAALIDFAADAALMERMGRLVPTIDMRVDYHRMAKRGDLTAKGRVVRLGKQFSVCEASLYDEAGVLIASGRGVYVTSPPDA
jgi:uncharacterized protein (TIGR00369 family)